jgi:curved DNA-binding protein CbpA
MKNYYRILGVDEAATQEEIQIAYRAKQQTVHSSTGGDEITEAFEFFGDPDTRRVFDQNLNKKREGVSQPSAANLPQQPSPSQTPTISSQAPKSAKNPSSPNPVAVVLAGGLGCLGTMVASLGSIPGLIMAAFILLLGLALYFDHEDKVTLKEAREWFRQSDAKAAEAKHQLELITQTRPAGYPNPLVSFNSLSGWWNRKFSDNDPDYRDYRYPATLRVVGNRIIAYQYLTSDEVPVGIQHLKFVGDLSALDGETLTVKWKEADDFTSILYTVTNHWTVDNKDYWLIEPRNDAGYASSKAIQQRLVIYANAKGDELWVATREGRSPDFGNGGIYVKARLPAPSGSR